MNAPASASTLVYRIDALDRIVAVNPAWNDFARANGGESMLRERVIGRVLWQFIHDPTINDIYRRIVNLARAGRPVTFHCRCDAPHSRRVFKMSVNAEEGQAVVFNSSLVEENRRAPIALLAARPRESTTFVRVCSWCHAIAWPGEPWTPLEQTIERVQSLDPAALPQLTHGICPDCATRMFQLLDEL